MNKIKWCEAAKQNIIPSLLRNGSKIAIPQLPSGSHKHYSKLLIIKKKEQNIMQILFAETITVSHWTLTFCWYMFSNFREEWETYEVIIRK